MRIHYIQHVEFERVGIIEDWAAKKGYVLSGTHTYKGEVLPSVSEFDALVIMGGPQGFDETDKYPYLKDETALITQAIEGDKIVIGFCLGAQLISQALDAPCSKSPNKEVGVFPISLTAEGQADPIFEGFPSSFKVIHWHNDMPGLPEGARLLATSEGCPRQAFAYKNNVYGFQFHMEITPDIAADLVKNCPGDLAPGKYVQTAEQFLEEDFGTINQQMTVILDRLVDQGS